MKKKTLIIARIIHNTSSRDHDNQYFLDSYVLLNQPGTKQHTTIFTKMFIYDPIFKNEISTESWYIA